jgi:hypothetical protein
MTGKLTAERMMRDFPGDPPRKFGGRTPLPPITSAARPACGSPSCDGLKQAATRRRLARRCARHRG